MTAARKAEEAKADDRFGGFRSRIAEQVSKLRHDPQGTVRDRWHRVRSNLVLAFQAGVAAALAWIISHELIGNPEPVFAPIAAVGTLAASVGQRLARTAELVFGVALGIGAADLLILGLGTGPWQLGLIVVLAIVVAVFLGAGPGGVTQAAATGVLVAVLSPRHPDLEYARVLDAGIGGFVGLMVSALLLPLNPLRVVERAARPALDMLADQLEATGRALERGDAQMAQGALDRLRELDARMSTFDDALAGGRETANLAPIRWHRRAALTQYVESAEYIEHAAGNSGALVRRAVTALEDGEPVPPTLPSAVMLLAEAVRVLHRELVAGREPKEARQRAIDAVGEAGRAYDTGVGFSGSVVVAQVRTAASDLIRATGIARTESNKLVRRAFGSSRGTETTRLAGMSGDARQPPDGSRQPGPDRSRQPAADGPRRSPADASPDGPRQSSAVTPDESGKGTPDEPGKVVPDESGTKAPAGKHATSAQGPAPYAG